MKVKVNYWMKVEDVLEVDDKFEGAMDENPDGTFTEEAEGLSAECGDVVYEMLQAKHGRGAFTLDDISIETMSGDMIYQL